MESDNPAEMNMTYFLYVIKDVMEHVGLFADSNGKNAVRVEARKAMVAREKQEVLKEKQMQLEEVKSNLEKQLQQWMIKHARLLRDWSPPTPWSPPYSEISSCC